MTATAASVGGYLVTPNRLVAAGNGIDAAYRDVGEGEGSPALVLLQELRGAW